MRARVSNPPRLDPSNPPPPSFLSFTQTFSMPSHSQFLLSLHLLSATSVLALVRSDWPPGFATPPTNTAWTQSILNGINVPSTPPRPAGSSSQTTADPSDITACPDANAWAPTYDDGPGPETDASTITPLDTRKLKGTFFVTGQQVAEYPDVLLKAFKSGHQIAIHTWSHKALSTLTNDEIVAEIVWTARIIKEVTGSVPTMMRPPFADIDTRVRAIVNAMGLKIVMWNRDTNDWCYNTRPAALPCAPSDTAAVIPRQFQTWVQQVPQQGVVSLQHDFFAPGASQIPATLDILSGSSYKVSTVAECTRFPPYDNAWLDKLTATVNPSDSSKKGTDGGNNQPGNNQKGTTPAKSAAGKASGWWIVQFFAILIPVALFG